MPALYLLATLDDFEDVRQLRVHRFISAKLLPDQPRRVPLDFSLDAYIGAGGFDYLEGEPLRLVALFEPEAALHLRETTLSADQQLLDHEDSWVRLTATVADSPMLRWWLLGFGANVEVLEPVTLRQELSETAQGMARRYRQPQPAVTE
jgi:predicted DNA-binding transcriptional regulator YafY